MTALVELPSYNTVRRHAALSDAIMSRQPSVFAGSGYPQNRQPLYPQEHRHHSQPHKPIQPRLPSMMNMIPGPGNQPHVHGTYQHHHPDAFKRPAAFTAYATPSPVEQSSPPQFPISLADMSPFPRRLQTEFHPSPTQSSLSTLSERSFEDGHEMSQRAMNVGHYPHRRPTFTYEGPGYHQPSPVSRGAPSVFSTPTPRATSSAPSSSPRQEHAPMSLSNILSTNDETSLPPQSPTAMPGPAPRKFDYRLRIRQQPMAARSCGFGERDRRVIDPPPILSLTVHDLAGIDLSDMSAREQIPSLSNEDMATRARTGMAVVHCSIYDETGTREMSIMPEDHYRMQRRLMGTLTGCPFPAQDDRDADGIFFPFPDLSCRTPGRYRLRFTLVVPDPGHNKQGFPSCPFECTVFSDVFQVYNAKDFPGMQASTALTRKLKEQGCLISIKKGNNHGKSARSRRRSRSESDDEDSFDEDDEERGHKSKKKRKSSP